MTFNWLVDFINFVTNNKVALVTTAGVLSEIVVIIINTIRKLHHNKKEKSQAATEAMSVKIKSKSNLKDVIVWSINPVNLFKSIKK